MKSRLFGLLAGIGICALAVQPAAALGIFTFLTPAGSTCGGQACSAQAVIVTVTEPGVVPTVAVNLTNTLNANQIISAGQALSGFSFTLSHAFANPGSPPPGGCDGCTGQYWSGRHCNVRDREGGAGAVAGGRPSPSGRHWDFHRFG
jgi:hypothetical protein